MPATELAFVLFSVFIAVHSDEEGNAAIQYNKESFNEEIVKAPHFVKFYAPWCGHCKRLAPTWEELGTKYNVEGKKEKVIIAKVDCTQETALCSDHGVTGYPTLKFFDKDATNSEKYKGGRDLETLSNWVDQQVGKTAEKDEPGDTEIVEKQKAEKQEAGAPQKENGVWILGGDTFNKHIEKGSHFIKFFAPWCGHCKRLAPTWEQLGEAFSEDKDVTIAKVDCTEHREVCAAHDVRGYPTLLWFQGGQKSAKYGGGRDLDSLSQYINSMKKQANKNADSTADKVPEKKEGDQAAKDGDVFVLSEGTFDGVIEQGFSFVKFYAPWCGHCKRLAPAWQELGTKFKDQSKVNIAKVDCTVEKDLCTKHGIRGYPTLKVFQNGEEADKYNGGRDLESLSNFVKEKIPQEAETGDAAQEPVLDLNEDNFENSIAKGTTFVKFFAPWCGHCKRLAPTWEELGQKYAENKHVTIAKIDCTQENSKEVCSKYGVRGYPTLILYRNGAESGKHNGARDLQSLADFVESKGPHDEL